LAAGPLQTTLPGALAAGTIDHVFHLLLGGAFLIAGLAQKRIFPTLRTH
jgi:hypothetical protein